MNIFDGFEDQTAEQVAKKLGVKKETLVQETKEEILDIKEHAYLLSNEEFTNKKNWEKISSTDELQVGMRLKYEGNPAQAVIIGIVDKERKIVGHSRIDVVVDLEEEEREIKVLDTLENLTYTFSYTELKEHFQLYKQDKEGITVAFNKVTSIKNIKPGTLVCEKEDEEISSIVQIRKDEALGKKTLEIQLSNNSTYPMSKKTFKEWYVANIQYPTPAHT